ncbi:MAG TPA: PQQ-binding-like beta-propeller repeat protein [Prolixibacteraceae bacterium]|nr:PQQ-binding-like beta-propeller repeat protein [Prolixibacteraceae bacterium]HPS12526.1 PQQ-binding-like beta-propeller repeat protein [Prolixibacteraceae bacterium]
MNKFIFIFISLLSSVVSFAQSPEECPNSRGNASLQGVTSASFPQKVKLKWSYDADGIFKSAPVISNGKIVVGSTNGDLLCLDFNGKLLWKFKTENGFEAPALIHDGTVYAGNLSGILYAIDLKSGTKKWEYKTENQIMGAPAFAELKGKKVIAAGSYDFFLHGVDAQTGKGLWKYESDNYLNSSPAISNDRAIFGGCDGFLHMVSLKDGSLVSKNQIATYVASSPAIDKNLAFVGDYDGGFSCIDLVQKKTIWKYENKESSQPFIASPSLADNKVVIGSRDKFVYCFNKDNGTICWKTNTGNRVEASTVVNKKQVLVANMRGDVMLLDLKTGKTVWTYELGVAVMNTPAVVEGAIVLAGNDGNIYFLSADK